LYDETEVHDMEENRSLIAGKLDTLESERSRSLLGDEG
jgi:hypothetical protein